MTLFDGVLKDRRLWQREILAGITAFFAISYIIVVNPMILADAGIPAELSVFATIFSSIIGCLIMAFVADAPIVLTPGMGVNAFFTYTICVQMGLTWQEANKKAYEELYAETVAFATAYPRQTPRG